MGVSRPKERRYEVPTLAVEDQERVVDMLAVIAVVVGAFLLAVGRVVCRVELQKHPVGHTVLLSLGKIKPEENLGDSAAGASGGGVLKAADGRLARKVLPALGKRAAAEFEQRVFPESIRVVLVLVSASYLENALPDE